MRRVDLRGKELESEALELEPREEGRARGERVHSGADVVPEAGKRQFGRAGPAAHLVRSLYYLDRAPRARQLDRRREAVRPRTDDDRVKRAHAGAAARGLAEHSSHPTPAPPALLVERLLPAPDALWVALAELLPAGHEALRLPALVVASDRRPICGFSRHVAHGALVADALEAVGRGTEATPLELGLGQAQLELGRERLGRQVADVLVGGATV